MLVSTSSTSRGAKSPRLEIFGFSLSAFALTGGVAAGVVAIAGFQLLEGVPAVWTAHAIAVSVMSMLVLPFALLTGLLSYNLIRWLGQYSGAICAEIAMPDPLEEQNPQGAVRE